MKKYIPSDIERKWQQCWEEEGTYVADLDSGKEKYIGFAMFNYPSGAGIHVGHAKNFTLPDVILRAKRQQGYEAYLPVGFDSFGLPTENYAIKAGESPRKTTDEAIANYRTQYRAMGWGMDWSKEIDTSRADYYKWTQWCFLKLHKHGLAYQKESLQWWCDECKTVLADEQVVAGRCWRHDDPEDPLVTKRSLNQWFFRITDYADEILEATDDLSWTPWVKTAQKNWIGRSEGAEVKFQLIGLGADDQHLEVFTTALETIHGVTFMVLAPEHPFVSIYGQQADNARDIDEYVQRSLRKSDVDREKEKVKTGVPIEGLWAINPVNGERVPVWIAEYVLIGYGSGAIMAVPGQDERDYRFAQKYELPIIYTTDRNEFVNYVQDIKADRKKFLMANSGEFTGNSLEDARGFILEKLAKDGSAEVVVKYRLRDWLISRQRYWGAPIPIIHCEEHGAVPVPEDQLPVELPEIDDYKPSGDGRGPLAKVEAWVNAPCPTCGKPGKRETDTMDGYVCSSWYQLRYTDPHNDRQAWNPERASRWLPVDFYNGGDHATAHLLYARFFTRFFHKLGLVDKPEPFVRMYFHAKIMAPDGTAFSKSKDNGVDPLEVINSGYGADALRTYIMFMAPPDVESPWNSEGVSGAYRFLNRVWALAQQFMEDAEITDSESIDGGALLQTVHRMIKKVSDDIEEVKLNTAISAMMEATNEMYRLKDAKGFESGNWQFAIESLLQCLAPFAPHITEELWQQLGHKDSIHRDHWPELDEQFLTSEILKLAVQINGKVRAEIEIAAASTEDTIKRVALEQENVQRHLASKVPKSIIYVPGRLVNVVV
jgi:leucyl-tRNA synthetase